jgi:predicted metal-dependent phosphoesterase TrpH
VSETRVDPHVKILDERVVDRAKARGLDVLVYAPHFTRYPTARERARRHSDAELTVIPAREIFTGSWRARKHVLALDLDAPIPDFITLEGAMAELARQDAVVLAPHPEFLSVGLDRADLTRYADQFTALEVYNPKHLPRHNRGASSLFEDLDVGAFGSSYAHRVATVGEVWTTVDGQVETATDLATALTGDTRTRVKRQTGRTHDLRRAIEFAHLGWENSWEKVDRLFLSGTEPTHPEHVAYDGRFDDVAVY